MLGCNEQADGIQFYGEGEHWKATLAYYGNIASGGSEQHVDSNEEYNFQLTIIYQGKLAEADWLTEMRYQLDLGALGTIDQTKRFDEPHEISAFYITGFVESEEPLLLNEKINLAIEWDEQSEQIPLTFVEQEQE